MNGKKNKKTYQMVSTRTGYIIIMLTSAEKALNTKCLIIKPRLTRIVNYNAVVSIIIIIVDYILHISNTRLIRRATGNYLKYL